MSTNRIAPVASIHRYTREFPNRVFGDETVLLYHEYTDETSGLTAREFPGAKYALAQCQLLDDDKSPAIVIPAGVASGGCEVHMPPQPVKLLRFFGPTWEYVHSKWRKAHGMKEAA